MLFKIGDRVRCINNKNNEGFYSVGAEGKIIQIDDDGDIWIQFDKGTYASYKRCAIKGWCCNPNKLELIK